MRWLLFLVLAVLFSAPATADELRPFSIVFTERTPGEWTLDWKQPLASPQGVAAVVPRIPANCQYSGDPVLRPGTLAILGHASVQCQGSVSGGVIGLPELLGNSDALVIVAPLERAIQTHRLTAAKPLATVLSRPDPWHVFRDYLIIGAEHILMGWDHLLFVIALVLLVQGGWAVVKAATAFTVAHSITLVATTLGYAGMPQQPVEALIALSIVFLAVELMVTDRETWTRRWPWVVAFAFGLLHGFGFAGALREIGLPEGEVPLALVAFNLGVEAGQLLVIAAVIGVRFAIQRWLPRTGAPALKIATYGIGIIASYWLVDRVIS